MTQFTLSSTTQSFINTAVNDGPGTNNINYYNAYQAIYADIEANGGVNSGTAYWFSQAGSVNRQQYVGSSAGLFIWTYTKTAVQSEGGSLTTAQLQAASNTIASTVFQSLQSNDFVFSDVYSATQTNFSPKSIVAVDAGAGYGQIQADNSGANLDYAGWAGTLFAQTSLNDSTYAADYGLQLSLGSRDCLAIMNGLDAAAWQELQAGYIGSSLLSLFQIDAGILDQCGHADWKSLDLTTSSPSLTVTNAGAGIYDIDFSQALSDGGTYSINTAYNGGSGAWTATSSDTNGSAQTTDETAFTYASGTLTADLEGLNSSGGVTYTQDSTTTEAGAVSATITGTGDVTNLGDASISLAADAVATAAGEANSITEAAGAVLTLSSASGSSSATLSGAGATVTDNGASNTIAVTASGGNDTVNENTSGGSVSVSGNGWLGNADTVNMSSGTVIAGSNSRTTLNGSTDTVNGGTDDSVGIAGSDDTINAGAGANLWLNSGDTNTVNVSSGTGSDVYVFGNGRYGNADTVNMSGGTVNGETNTRTNLNGSGDGLSGTTDVTVGVAGSGDTLSVGAGADIWLNSGNTNTVNVSSGSGSAVYVFGNGEYGNADTVDMSNGTVTAATNTRTTLNGSDNVVDASTDDSVGVSGNDNTINAGIGGNLWINSGSSNTVEASSGAVYVGDAEASVVGSGDTVNLNSTGGQAFVSGADVAISGGSVTMSGAQEDLSFGTTTLSIDQGNSASLTGSDGTLTATDPTSGQVTTSIEWDGGGSQEGFFTGLASGLSSQFYNYSEADLAGSLNTELLNYSSGGSVVEQLSGQPYGIQNFDWFYSGNSGTGTLDTGKVYASAGMSLDGTGATLAVYTFDGGGDYIGEFYNGGSAIGEAAYQAGSEVAGSSEWAELGGYAEDGDDGYGLNGDEDDDDDDGNIFGDDGGGGGGDDGDSMRGGGGLFGTGGGTTISSTGATLTLSDGETATVTGSGNTITTGSNDTVTISDSAPNTFLVAGTGSTLTDSGMGDSYAISGQDNALAVSNASIAIADGVTVSLSSIASTIAVGNGDSVSLDNNSMANSITLSGTGSTVADSGIGEAIAVSGGGNTLDFSGAQAGTLQGLLVATNGGSEQITLQGMDSVTVVNGVETSVVGTDGTLTVNNGVGSVVQNTIDWTAGGSEIQNFTSLAGGGLEEDDLGYSGSNGSGTQLYEQVITSSAGSPTTVAISGQGAVNGTSDASVTLADDASATFVNGGNTIALGNSDTVTLGSGSLFNTLNVSGAGSAIIDNGTGSSVTVNGASSSVSVGGGDADSGSATIAGTGDLLELTGASSAAVTFGSGASGVLKLDAPLGFSGTVAGLADDQGIDLTGLSYGACTTLGFTENSADTAGTLTLSDGAINAQILLLGQYTAASFRTASNGGAGTLVALASTTDLTPLLAAAHG